MKLNENLLLLNSIIMLEHEWVLQHENE